jgi:hypothetical protein
MASKVKTVDEFCQLFRVGDEFYWPKNTSLRHTTVNSIHMGLLILCSTSKAKTEPGQSQFVDTEAMSQNA